MVTTCNGGGWIVVYNNNDENIYFVHDGNEVLVGVNRGRTNGCDIFIGTPIEKPKEKPIDRNHPHQCFQCKKPLRFSELLMRNLSVEFQMTCIGPYYITFKKDYKIYKHLKKLWKNKYVQFYCCQCYSMLFIL